MFRADKALKGNATQTVAASAVEQVVSQTIVLTAKDALNFYARIKMETAQEVTGITFNLQDSVDNVTWYDVGSQASVSVVSKTFTDANVSSALNSVHSATHGFTTAQLIQYKATGATVVVGLTNDAFYYIIRLDANNLQFATTSANASAGTAINISAPAGGDTHTITLVDASFLDAAVSSGDDTITITAHGFSNGNRLKYVSTSAVTGLTTAVIYYVVGATANTIQLSATSGGAAINLTQPAGGVTHYLIKADFEFADADVTSGAETIAITAHGLATASMVRYVSSAAGVVTGLADNGLYWVINASANTIKLATSAANANAGTAIDITAPVAGDKHYITALNDDFADAAVVDLADQIAITSHGWTTGDEVHYVSSSAVNGLTTATTYYVINTSTHVIQLATTRANALAGTAIDINRPVGGATHYLTQIDPLEIILNIENSSDEAQLPLMPNVRIVCDSGASDACTISDIRVIHRT